MLDLMSCSFYLLCRLSESVQSLHQLCLKGDFIVKTGNVLPGYIKEKDEMICCLCSVCPRYDADVIDHCVIGNTFI